MTTIIEEATPTTTDRGTRGGKRRNGGVAIAIGILACSGVVWQSSHAAFSGTTSNDANTVGAGTVALADNDATAVMINASNLVPGGSAQTACIGVQYTGTITPSAIKVYFAGAQEREGLGGSFVAWANTGTTQLDDYLNMKIEVNTTDMAAAPTSLTDCTPTGYTAYNATPVLAAGVGSLKTAIGANTNFGNGLASQWGTVTQNKWRVFKFTYSLDSTAPDAAQGDAVKFNVVWEAQQ